MSVWPQAPLKFLCAQQTQADRTEQRFVITIPEHKWKSCYSKTTNQQFFLLFNSNVMQTKVRHTAEVPGIHQVLLYLLLTLMFWFKLLSKYANIFRQPRTPVITNSSRIPGKTGKPFHVYQLQQPSFLTSHNFRTLSTVLFLIEGKSCFRRVLHLHFMRSVSAEALTGAAKACLLQWWEQVWVSYLTSAVSIWHGEEISHHL